MQLEKGEIRLQKGAANLSVRLLQPSAAQLTYRQTDQFAVPVHPKYATKMKPEWHVSAGTVKPAQNQQFLALLYPYRSGDDPKLKSKLLPTRQGTATEVKEPETTSFILFGGETQRTVSGPSFALDGLAAALSQQQDHPVAACFVETTHLETPDLRLTASIPLTGECQFESNRLQVTLNPHPDLDLQLRTGFAPHQLTQVAPTDWQYDASAHLLKVKVRAGINRFEVR